MARNPFSILLGDLRNDVAQILQAHFNAWPDVSVVCAEPDTFRVRADLDALLVPGLLVADKLGLAIEPGEVLIAGRPARYDGPPLLVTTPLVRTTVGLALESAITVEDGDMGNLPFTGPFSHWMWKRVISEISRYNEESTVPISLLGVHFQMVNLEEQDVEDEVLAIKQALISAR